MEGFVLLAIVTEEQTAIGEDPVHVKNQQFDLTYRKTLPSESGSVKSCNQKGRGYKGYVRARNLYMIRNTYPTSVYVELANIRNAADQERLVLNSNREALAKWLYEGLAGYTD